MTNKDVWEGTGSDAFPARGEEWPNPNGAGTITPPSAERLSPYLRAELDRIRGEVEAAQVALKRLLDQA